VDVPPNPTLTSKPPAPIPPLSSLGDPELESLLMTSDLLSDLSDVPLAYEDDLDISIPAQIPGTSKALSADIDKGTHTIDDLEVDQVISAALREIKNEGPAFVDYTDVILLSPKHGTFPTSTGSQPTPRRKSREASAALSSLEDPEALGLISQVVDEIHLEKTVEQRGAKYDNVTYNDYQLEQRIQNLKEFQPAPLTSTPKTSRKEGEEGRGKIITTIKTSTQGTDTLGAPPAALSLSDFRSVLEEQSSGDDEDEEFCCICVAKAQVLCPDCEDFYCVKCFNRGHVDTDDFELRFHKPKVLKLMQVR
jgi:hypothetical protein